MVSESECLKDTKDTATALCVSWIHFKSIFPCNCYILGSFLKCNLPQFYSQAVELNPREMTFLSNIAAVKFEQKSYAECVDFCARAIDVGRENRADFKVRTYGSCLTMWDI